MTFSSDTVQRTDRRSKVYDVESAGEIEMVRLPKDAPVASTRC